jgi:hypothetical protein
MLPDANTVFEACGAVRVDRAAPGDILAIAPGPGQRHFGIATPLGLIHAHAGLERVVEGPLDPNWSIIAVWRLAGAR